MPRKGKKQLAAEQLALADRLGDYVAALRLPNGFSKLGTEGRKLLLALLASAMVPADGVIRDEEVDRLRFYLLNRYDLDTDAALHLPTLVRQAVSQDQLLLIATSLKDMLAMEDRCRIVQVLWDIAMSDHELHQMEESLIYAIADAAAVPRKLVVEQQRLAAGAAVRISRRS